jgi:hypothetical protein
MFFQNTFRKKTNFLDPNYDSSELQKHLCSFQKIQKMYLKLIISQQNEQFSKVIFKFIFDGRSLEASYYGSDHH